ncbi:hypothetical protein FHG87_011315 [Trinorchestia longiramus]|nr:hypothetical protein FHG87_011315 [Trinorchestia longiramus]
MNSKKDFLFSSKNLKKSVVESVEILAVNSDSEEEAGVVSHQLCTTLSTSDPLSQKESKVHFRTESPKHDLILHNERDLHPDMACESKNTHRNNKSLVKECLHSQSNIYEFVRKSCENEVTTEEFSGGLACKTTTGIKMHGKASSSLRLAQNSIQFSSIIIDKNEKTISSCPGDVKSQLLQQKVHESGDVKVGTAIVNVSHHNKTQSASTSCEKIVHRKKMDASQQCRGDALPAVTSTVVDVGDFSNSNEEFQTSSSKRKRKLPIPDFACKLSKASKKYQCSVRENQSYQFESENEGIVTCGQSNVSDSRSYMKVSHISDAQLHHNDEAPGVSSLQKKDDRFKKITVQRTCSVSSSKLIVSTHSSKWKLAEIEIPYEGKSSSFAPAPVEQKQSISKCVQQFTEHSPMCTKLSLKQVENIKKNEGPEEHVGGKLKQNSCSEVKGGASTNSQSVKEKLNVELKDSQKKASDDSTSSKSKSSCQPPTQKQHNCYTMSGTLVALSHTFWLSTGKMYLAQFYLDNDCPHPLLELKNAGHEGGPVNIDPHTVIVMVCLDATCASWRAQLQLGVRFSISGVEACLMWRGDARIAALAVIPSSILRRVDPVPAMSPSANSGCNCPQEQTEASSATGASNETSCLDKFLKDGKWVTYEGVVSKVRNINLGLYELDGGLIILALSHLMAVVDEGKYWRNACGGGDVEGLAVGCWVSVQRPHLAKLPSGTLLLTCCGRTMVTVEQKKSEARTDVMSAVLDAVIRHSLPGYHWLVWLADLETLMCDLLVLLGLPPHVVKRHTVRDGSPTSPLSRLLQGWSDRVSLAALPRRLVEEFCAPKHTDCAATRGITQKFVAPFNILTAAAVEDKEREKLVCEDSNSDKLSLDSKVRYWRSIITPLGLLPNDCDATSGKQSTAEVDSENKPQCKDTSSRSARESEVTTNEEEWMTDSVILCRLQVTSSGELIVALQDERPKLEMTRDERMPENISAIPSMVKWEDKLESEQSLLGSGHNSLFKSVTTQQPPVNPGLQSTYKSVELCDKSSDQSAPRTSYHLVVVGVKSHIDPSMAGKIVALFNPILVTEVFEVFRNPILKNSGYRTVYKRYLMVRAKDILKIYDDFEGQEQDFTDATVNQSQRDHQHSGEKEQNSSVQASCEGMRGSKEDTEYLITVSGKLNRVVPVHAIRRNILNKHVMFLCKARVLQKNKYHNDNVLPHEKFGPVSDPKNQQVSYLRFEGPQQLPYFCYLSDTCGMRARVSSNSTFFSKSISHHWLPAPTASWTAAAECMIVPENAFISDISHTYAKDEISVSDACRGSFISGCLLTVVGMVKERFHMTTLYEIEKMNLSEECDMNDIGVPGCKTIRLLLIDDDNDDPTISQIYVYLSLKSKMFVGKYPRGLIEGTRVRISDVSMMKSASTKTSYISAKQWSVIQVLSLPPLSFSSRDRVDEGQNITAKFKFLFEITKELGSVIHNLSLLANPMTLSLMQASCETEENDKVHSFLRNIPAGPGLHIIKEPCAPRSSYRSARVLASVQRLVKLRLYFQCPDCNTEISTSTCSYAGCHSRRDPILTAFAKLIVEDSLSQANVIIKNENFLQILLGIPKSKWKTLISTLTELRLPLTYIPMTNSKFGYVEPELDCLDNTGGRDSVLQVCTQIVHNYVSTGALYQPLLLTLRVLKPCADYAARSKEGISYYCLYLSHVVCKNAVELLDRNTPL